MLPAAPRQELLREPALNADQPDVSRLLRLWEMFVGEVEGGYSATIDDYTNDLTVRDLLEQALAEGVAADEAARVAALDDRLREATRPDETGRLAEVYAVGDEWWWHRLPRTGSLAASVGPGR